jgi:ElaB/YqjD/DUF883 family membrane-anchored ribosome-binding protein
MSLIVLVNGATPSALEVAGLILVAWTNSTCRVRKCESAASSLTGGAVRTQRELFLAVARYRGAVTFLTTRRGMRMSERSDFTRALGDAKKQAKGLAEDATGAAQDLYDHARDSAADLADSANKAAHKTANSFERAVRNTIENQPYTAVAIALGLGWLLGRLHRPL